MMVWFTPSMIDGLASGTCTSRSSWRVVLPNDSATSSEVVGTSRTPSAVSRIAGGRANASVARRAGGIPIPKSSTNGRRYEYAGDRLHRVEDRTKTRSTFGRRPAQIPSGIPISSASETEISSSAIVSTAGIPNPEDPEAEHASRREQRHPPACDEPGEGARSPPRARARSSVRASVSVAS